MVYVFGLSLALLIYEIGFHGWFFTIVYLPMMVSGLAMGYMATMLFAKSTGTVNLMLGEWFNAKNLIDIQDPTGTSIILPIMIGWRYAGFNVAIFLAGLLAIPAETIEAATVDGASYWQRVWHVYFPQMLPVVHHRHHLLPDRLVRRVRRAHPARRAEQQPRGADAVGAVLFLRIQFEAARLGADAHPRAFLPLVFIAFFLQRLQRRLQY